jgi:hypothetical protein
MLLQSIAVKLVTGLVCCVVHYDAVDLGVIGVKEQGSHSQNHFNSFSSL